MELKSINFFNCHSPYSFVSFPKQKKIDCKTSFIFRYSFFSSIRNQSPRAIFKSLKTSFCHVSKTSKGFTRIDIYISLLKYQPRVEVMSPGSRSTPYISFLFSLNIFILQPFICTKPIHITSFLFFMSSVTQLLSLWMKVRYIFSSK